jgi:DNA-binding NarL/FixJ family response regulator
VRGGTRKNSATARWPPTTERRREQPARDERDVPGEAGREALGLHAAREIRVRYPEVGVLVLSQYARPSYAFALLSESAEGVGYLLKDRVGDLAELADAVRRVGEGGSVLDPVIVSQLVGRPRDGPGALQDLTESASARSSR